MRSLIGCIQATCIRALWVISVSNFCLLIPFTAESGETAVLFYPSHSHDDTQRLQTHIDNLTLKNGGEIRFVSGRYRLMGVQAKSNVHLSFSEGVTIEPIPSKGRNIFECGVEKSSISNVAFTGPKKLVLVDFRNDAVKPRETKLRLFMINDCQDFRISNFKGRTKNLCRFENAYYS